MKQVFRKIVTLLTVYYAYMLEYRAELFLWALSGSLPIILMGVWIEASTEGNFGLGPQDFARYFITVFFVRQFSIVWVIWDFEREVLEGTLSFRLLQPLDPGWHHVASHVGERFARLPFICVLTGLFFLLYPDAFWLPSWSQGLLFLLVSLWAFALRFIIQYTFAMFAFWTERANALQQFWFLFYLFLSGTIAPLEVFPPSVRAIAQFTPFPYLIHFPAAILVGLPVNIAQGIVVAIAWFVLFFFLNRWLWRRGLKQYSGMGA
ncbi:ABC-2 family transporter protein [Oscillatoria salina]|nr:multidrug ABC transporter permease [Oscillatoria salina IIICB1]